MIDGKHELKGTQVRRRIAELLAALSAEDLEERIAPVKCAKHPDHADCTSEYGTVDYGVPGESRGEPEE